MARVEPVGLQLDGWLGLEMLSNLLKRHSANRSRSSGKWLTGVEELNGNIPFPPDTVVLPDPECWLIFRLCQETKRVDICHSLWQSGTFEHTYIGKFTTIRVSMSLWKVLETNFSDLSAVRHKHTI